MVKQPCVILKLIATSLLQLIYLLSMTRPSLADKVHLNYTSQYTTGQLTPDDVTVTLSREAGDGQFLGEVHLKRSPIQIDVPIYSIWRDKDGKLSYVRENLPDRENVRLYQDVATEAVIQITSISVKGESKPRLVLKGELSLDGQKYTLNPDHTRQRRDVSSSLSSPSSSSSYESSNASQSTDMHSSSQTDLGDNQYELNPEESKTDYRGDGLRAGPELKISLTPPKKSDPFLVTIRSDKLKSSLAFSPSNQTLPSISYRKSKNPKPRRRMRRQSSLYYVDVVAVVDYGAYQRFLRSAVTRDEALEAVREYYAFVFTGMNLRFQNVPNINYGIQVSLTKVIISETATASSFTENFRLSGSPWDTVDALNALESFSEFAVGTGAEFLNPYDHSILFTGYDLTSTTAGGSTTTTTGLAYTGTLCRTDGKSVSVVEDLGGFQSIDTATHELGHSLSAKHDGEDNACLSTDRYIMAGGTYPVTTENALNPWYFSTCSASYFTNFINDEMKNSRGATCLTQALPVSASIPDVSDRLPGQEVTPDEQCAQIYGSESRLCRGSEFGDDICTQMFCYDPATEGTCYEQTAARGTTCGDGKICLEGQCVADSRAPSVDENCLFGDQPGAAFSDQTCEDFVNGFTGYCYQELVRGRCCASCKAVYRQVIGCEYGDQSSGCESMFCGLAGSDYQQQCCGTCNYGVPFTTTTPTTTTTTTDAPATSGGCYDNPDILVNQLPCSLAVSSSPSVCYQSSVLSECCASCASANTGDQNCEYGDLYPDSCSAVTDCTGLDQACCRTCGATTTPISPICEDNPGILVNSLPCASAVLDDPRVCATPQVAAYCCFSCQQEVTTTTTTTTSQVPPGTSITVTTEAPTCLDNPMIQVNQMSCSDAIEDDKSLCYNQEVALSCCASCARANTGINDCEFGDHYPRDCDDTVDCSENTRECCATCSAGGEQGGTSSGRKTQPMLSWLNYVVVIATVHFVRRFSAAV